MLKTGRIYDQIIKYLRGMLTNRERHDLEREMMSDPFDEEAFEGFSGLTADELDADMNSMMSRLDNRLQKGRKISIMPILKIAAGLAILLGIGAVLYSVLKAPEPELITRQEPVIQPGKAPETANQSESLSSSDSEAKETIKKEERKSGSVDYDSELMVAEDVSDRIKSESENLEVVHELNIAAPERAEASVNEYDSAVSYPGYITGRVLGVNRKALAGVSVMDESSGLTTVTDASGNFHIKVSDLHTKLELNYEGYKSREVPSREIAGKEITLDEENPQSGELVVLNYDVKSESIIAKRKIAAEAASKSTDVYSRPLPPGGSMKLFESWVENRIDTVALKVLLPGNYRIRLKFTVFTDGKIGNLSVPDDIPAIVAEEYKRALSMSELWQPARSGNQPVNADVMIEFSLIIK